MKINPQRSMGKTAMLALAAIGLAAASPVNARKPEPVAEIDFGPAPTWERYKELAERAVKRQLVDPYSAMFEWIWGFKQGEYKPFIGRRIPGYFTCGLVNARNRMGGYTGSSVSADGTWPCRHHRNRKARSL